MNTRVRVFRFIKSHIDKHGEPPNADEIAAHLGVTRTSIYPHLRRLKRQGILRWKPYEPHSIVLLVDTYDGKPAS